MEHRPCTRIPARAVYRRYGKSVIGEPKRALVVAEANLQGRSSKLGRAIPSRFVNLGTGTPGRWENWECGDSQ